MLEYLKSYLKYGSRFCGIEHTSKNGNDSIFISLLKRSKKEIDIELTHHVSSISEVAEKLHKKQHVLLVVNDQQVLSKIIESEHADSMTLVNKAFTNININDFYYNIISQNQKYIIAISRKEYVDGIIKAYDNESVSVIGFLLGHTPITTILEYLDNIEVFTSNSKISIQNSTIDSVLKEENSSNNEYDINGLKVVSNYLLSTSASLSNLFQTNTSVLNYNNKQTKLVENYLHKRFFNQFLKIGLGSLLVGLLINFFVFNHYFNKAKDLQAVSQINASSKSKTVTLKEDVDKVEKMVGDMLESNSSKTSYYLNTIINSMPNSIILTEFNYQPLLKRVKKEQPIQSTLNTIVVSGTSVNSENFSNWLTILERAACVNSIDILEYGSTSKTSEFKIKLQISDDQ